MADNIESKIKKEWITQAMSGMKQAEEEKISDASLDKEVVLLVQGSNLFGDSIYSYVKVALRNYRELRAAMAKGENFSPSDYGEVVAAGRGEPTEEIKDEMRVKYGMVDLTRQLNARKEAMAKAKPMAPQPAFFGDDDEE